MFYTKALTPSYMCNTNDRRPNMVLPKVYAKDFSLFNIQNASNANLSKIDLQIKQLKEEFELAKNEQGILGKSWDGIKNLFKTEYSSSNIEKELNKLSSKSKENDIKRIKDMIKQFRYKQDSAVDTITTTGSVIIIGETSKKIGDLLGSAIKYIIPKAGNIANPKLGLILGLAGCAITGALSNVCLNQIENMTDNIDNNSWHNDKKLKEEASTGAVLGAVGMLLGGISKKVSGLCKNALGMTKEGVALANNGSASVLKTICYTALAEAAGGAVSTIAISDGKYLIQCATDKDKTFSTEDLIQTTAISGITGGVINAGFGAYSGYKNAAEFNNRFTFDELGCSAKTEKTPDSNLTKTKKIAKKSMKKIFKKTIKSNFKKDIKGIIVKSKPVVVKGKPGVIYSPNDKRKKNFKVKIS